MNRLKNGTIAVGAPGSQARKEAEAEDAKRGEMLEYFEGLCGPHLDPDIYHYSNAELKEAYDFSQSETLGAICGD